MARTQTFSGVPALCPAGQPVLDVCGFPLCKGGVMAGNPRWCLSLGEWRGRFAEWMRAASADDLLNSSIFSISAVGR
jgi:signal-transduction protein with cAMP-binding, CBS, and nucleotidyltransferase domain